MGSTDRCAVTYAPWSAGPTLYLGDTSPGNRQYILVLACRKSLPSALRKGQNMDLQREGAREGGSRKSLPPGRRVFGNGDQRNRHSWEIRAEFLSGLHIKMVCAQFATY